MGTLKRIGNASQGEAQGKTTGGRLRRIDTGEIITYNPDPVRSLPQVSKITGGGQTASPSLPTLSDWSGGRRGEGNAAIAKVTELRDLRDEARQEFLNYRAASTAGITLGTPAAGEYTGRKYKMRAGGLRTPGRSIKKRRRTWKRKTVWRSILSENRPPARFRKDLGRSHNSPEIHLPWRKTLCWRRWSSLAGDELGTISDTAPFNTWAKNIREEQEGGTGILCPQRREGRKGGTAF